MSVMTKALALAHAPMPSEQDREVVPGLVSIVLPSYNGARYLRDALDSCLAQTYTPVEIILVDDASTDDTPRIIREYAARDPRIVVVQNDANQRLPRCLNIGFRHARGSYLTWTSDDNLFRPDAIALMVAALESRPRCGLVYCDYEVIGPAGEFIRLQRMRPPETLRERNCVGACFLYRRELYEAVGDYSDEMVLVEDYEYWVRASLTHELSYLEGQSPYRYRVHKESLTATRYDEQQLQHARMQWRYYKPCPSAGRWIALTHYDLLWYHRKRNDLRRALHHARMCLRLDPLRLSYWTAAAGTAVKLCLAPRNE